MKHTKKVTRAALFAAVMLLCLALASVMPGAALSAAALAGLAAAVMIPDCGVWFSLASYAITGILGMVLLPEKSSILLFLLLFGYYPVVKHIIERGSRVWLGWILKFCFAILVFLVLYFALPRLFLVVVPDWLSLFWAALVLYLLVFVVYDFAMTQAVLFIQKRTRRR